MVHPRITKPKGKGSATPPDPTSQPQSQPQVAPQPLLSRKVFKPTPLPPKSYPVPPLPTIWSLFTLVKNIPHLRGVTWRANCPDPRSTGCPPATAIVCYKTLFAFYSSICDPTKPALHKAVGHAKNGLDLSTISLKSPMELPHHLIRTLVVDRLLDSIRSDEDISHPPQGTVIPEVYEGRSANATLSDLRTISSPDNWRHTLKHWHGFYSSQKQKRHHINISVKVNIGDFIHTTSAQKYNPGVDGVLLEIVEAFIKRNAGSRNAEYHIRFLQAIFGLRCLLLVPYNGLIMNHVENLKKCMSEGSLGCLVDFVGGNGSEFAILRALYMAVVYSPLSLLEDRSRSRLSSLTLHGLVTDTCVPFEGHPDPKLLLLERNIWRVLMQCAIEGPEKHLDKFFGDLYDMIEHEPIHYGVGTESEEELDNPAQMSPTNAEASTSKPPAIPAEFDNEQEAASSKRKASPTLIDKQAADPPKPPEVPERGKAASATVFASNSKQGFPLSAVVWPDNPAAPSQPPAVPQKRPLNGDVQEVLDGLIRIIKPESICNFTDRERKILEEAVAVLSKR